MKALEIKKALLEVGDMIIQDDIESLAAKYKIPVEELGKIATMSRLNGRMEGSLEIEEMLLNGLKETEEG